MSPKHTASTETSRRELLTRSAAVGVASLLGLSGVGAASSTGPEIENVAPAEGAGDQ